MVLENTIFLSVGFVGLTIITVFWIARALRLKLLPIVLIVVWLLLIGILALNDFFLELETIPPRLFFVMIPLLFFTIVFPFTKAGKKLVQNSNPEQLTLIHSIRIVVEVVFLYQLAQKGFVSEILTFEGRNFDIIPGLTAPLIWFIYFRKKLITKTWFIIWNMLSLATLLFTISQGILSAPLPFQQFGFEQPTVAIFHFPFIWLPGFVAPVMIFSHIIAFHKYRNL